MRWRWPALWIVWVGVGLLGPRAAQACEPLLVAGDPSSVPSAWQLQLDALVEATRQLGQPWSCPAASASLQVEEGVGTLRIERPGAASMSRQLGAPEELVPLGKAMLARPAPPEPPPQITLPPGLGSGEAPGGAASEPQPPRALVEAAATVRYVGVSELMAVGVAARGTLPFDRWLASLWVRYTAFVADVGDSGADLDYSELVIGGAAGYSLLTEPVRLDAALTVGMAVVDMETQSTASVQDGPQEVQSGLVDGRVGLELALVVPLTEMFHLPIALDADLAPASLANSDRRLDPLLPPVPAYTLGLRAGLEVAIP